MTLAKILALATIILAGQFLPTVSYANETDEQLLWLEDSEDPRTQEWLAEQAKSATDRLVQDLRYDSIRQGLIETRTSSDQIVTGQYLPSGLYHLEASAAFPNGRMLRTPIDAVGGSTTPEVLLDPGTLETAGRRGCRFGGYPNFLHELDCLAPDYTRCLVPLSPDGRDAITVREFVFEDGAGEHTPFVTDHIALTHFGWHDEQSIVILTSLAETDALAARTGRFVRHWTRGTKLAEAPIAFDCGEAALRCDMTIHHSNGAAFPLVTVSGLDETGNPSRRTYLLDVEQNGSSELSLLSDLGAQILGVSDGRAMLLLGAPMSLGDTEVPEGSIISLPLVAKDDSSRMADVDVVFRGSRKQVINFFYGTAIGDETISLVVMEDVKSTLLQGHRKDGRWVFTPVDLPRDGTISIHGMTPTDTYVQYESFLVPPELWRVSNEGATKKLKALPAQFDASGLVTEQHFAQSADGTQVPYFVVRPKDTGEDKIPTLITGYGGFGLSQPPLYLNYTIARWLIFKPWFESGGAVVVANIRGGGEYGPSWCAAARGAGRIKSYEDFTAVTEDVIDSGLTESAKLGALGTSNGGLLLGAVLNERPELYGAATIGVPLLDMLRYTQLLAGPTWIPEYGDPVNNPEVRAFWERYSPFHNIRDCERYPAILVWGSGTDDRVHPGHGRRYAERLRACGGDMAYFETSGGGHFGSGTPEQLSGLVAMHAVYFLQELADDKD